MEAAFGWVSQLVQWFGSLIPRFVCIEATNVGVAFTRGAKVRPLMPGWYVYWPFWTVIYERVAKRQTHSLPPQALMTADGYAIVVGSMVRYDLVDAIQALVETHDVDQAIVDEALGVICTYVGQCTLETLRENRDGVNATLTSQIGQALACYGVRVLRAQLTHSSVAQTINHLGVTTQPAAAAQNVGI